MTDEDGLPGYEDLPEFQEGTPEYQARVEMIGEITGQTDRAAAIVAFAFLDDMLREVIQSHLYEFKYKGEDIQKNMFRGSGPLATFSARRRLAYLMGLFGPKTYGDLEKLAQIRNEFAHIRSRRTFDSQRIKDLCGGLQIPNDSKFAADFAADHKLFNLAAPFSENRFSYVNLIMYLCGTLRGIASQSSPIPHKHTLLP